MGISARTKRQGPRRSGLDRRIAERRIEERRKQQVVVAHEARSGTERRVRAQRSGQERRVLADRRRAVELSAGDRRRAREIPELVLAAKGTTFDRVVKVVRHTWKVAPMQVRAGIAQDLIPLLEPVVAGERPMDDHLREACEAVVSQWISRRH